MEIKGTFIKEIELDDGSKIVFKNRFREVYVENPDGSLSLVSKIVEEYNPDKVYDQELIEDQNVIDVIAEELESPLRGE